jgi:PAS domain S-box-containing protein
MGEEAPTTASGWTGDADDLLQVLTRAADGITVQASDGRIVYANDAAARQVGFADAREFLATPTAEIMRHYELLDVEGNAMPVDALPSRRALRGEPGSDLVVGFRVDGRPAIHWSVVRATPVTNADGSVRFVINVFHDISDLKVTETHLRALADAGAILAASNDYEAALRDLAELVVPTIADWCVVDVVDVGGVRRVAVAHPDPKKRALAEEIEQRYPPDPSRPGGVSEVVRTGVPQIVSTITDDMILSAARDAEHGGLILELGLGSAAIMPLVARDQVLGAISLARAKTSEPYGPDDLPFLEELARRAAVALDNSRLLRDAQEAVRLRDDFLAMASHDMRTPLGAILGNLQLAQRKLGRHSHETDGALARNLENAIRTTDKLARLVDELMDVTMMRSGQPLPLAINRIDLVELVTEVAADHQRQTHMHRIWVDGEGSLVGDWDRTRLERVLDNLIDNAVKYSPNGGEIHVRVHRSGDQALLSVTDHGIGIPAGEHETVFNAYQRASNTVGLRGIGLGLAGARQVLRELGGDLTVQSVQGDGSTFTIHLPLEGDDSPSSAGPPPESTAAAEAS